MFPVEAVLRFKNQKHFNEFIAQIYDGFGESYVSIEEEASRSGTPTFYIEMQENEYFREFWHVEQEIAPGIWLDSLNEGSDDKLEFGDRSSAIMFCIRAKDIYGNEFRIKEDYEDGIY